MDLLEIKVRNDRGERVAYTCDYLPMSKYRDYLQMQVELEAKSDVTEQERLEAQTGFIAGLFPGLTAEALYEGVEMSEFNDITSRVFVRLVGASPDPKD